MPQPLVAFLCLALVGSATPVMAIDNSDAGQPPAVVPVNLADTDLKPVMLSNVRPAYPDDLRAAGIEGHAVVDFLIDPHGVPTHLRIAHQTNAEFGVAAMASVSQWRFSPGEKNGAKVWVHIQIPIVFSLNVNQKGGNPNLPPIADLAPGETVFDISKVDRVPQPTFQARPDYPASLRASNTPGKTLIKFVVRVTGQVSNVEVVSATNPLFGVSAAEAVRRWKFLPARFNHQPVNCRLAVPIEFSLTH